MSEKVSKYRQRKLNDIAQKIIEDNQYVSLATTNSQGVPWISPVAYANDKLGNLYFASMPNSRHCENIRKNPLAACAVFSSTQKWGEGKGLQIEAEITECGFKDNLKAGKTYISRKYPYPNDDPRVVLGFVQNYLASKKLYKFYKITPKAIWMNDPYSETDKRVKVEIV